jgi:hypothetical protein
MHLKINAATPANLALAATTLPVVDGHFIGYR